MLKVICTNYPLYRNFINQSCFTMIRFAVFSFFLLPLIVSAQQITWSDYNREDTKDINFEIIGKMNGNFLVYKNLRWKHSITLYSNDLQTQEKNELTFMPDKTLNVDFVPYADHFYMVYQHQKKGILYCMGVKMGADGKNIGEPFEMDTTRIGFLSDNKIYSTFLSEDKKKVLVYKIQKRADKIHLTTLLYDNQLQLIKRSRNSMNFDDRREMLNDLQVDNNGNLLFTKGFKSGNRDYINELYLVTKKPMQDTLSYHKIELDKKYVDDIEVKIDNLNNLYLINTFYYQEKRGNIEGLFTYCYHYPDEANKYTIFIPFSDSLRELAKNDGQPRFAFNDYFIRQVVVKKDGGFILTAEDYSSQSRGGMNNWNRYDYLNSPYLSRYDYYYYNSPYNWYYRPSNTFGNQSTRYYYDNILVLSISNNAKLEWGAIIPKEQFDDDDDNYLSFGTLNTGGEINFLFNDGVRNQLVANQSVAPDGSVKRKPTLKSEEKGHKFMPRYAKQTGARQVLVPCTYRTGFILFAKIDF